MSDSLKWVVNKDVISGDVFYSITYEGSPNRLACRIPSEYMARMMAKAPQMAEELERLRSLTADQAAELTQLRDRLQWMTQEISNLNDAIYEERMGEDL